MNPFDQEHPSYPYSPGNHPIDWSLFPSDPAHLYHPDNVLNPFHPSNPNRIVLVGGVVLNPENPYNPASIHNPHHPLNPLGPPDSPTHPYHPKNPGNPLLPPIIPQPPVETCEFDFELTARSAPRPSERIADTQDSDVHFQVLHGLLKTPLIDGVFTFRQQFLEYVPDLRDRSPFRDKQTYCEDPHIPENEKLTLTVENSDGVFVLPTGGLGSSGAPCIFDWDIWVDYHYVGRYVGNSGLRTQGIELNLRPEAYQLAAGIKVSPRYLRISREKEIKIPIQVEADGEWECLPFWVKFSDGGVFIARNIGIYDHFLIADGLMQFNGGNTTITATKQPGAELSDRLLQGFVFYPKRRINGCAIELVLLDFCRPEQDLESLAINQQTIDVHYPCIEPKFMLGSSQVHVHLDSNLTEQAICVLNALLEEVVNIPATPTIVLPVQLGIRATAQDVLLLPRTRRQERQNSTGDEPETIVCSCGHWQVNGVCEEEDDQPCAVVNWMVNGVCEENPCTCNHWMVKGHCGTPPTPPTPPIPPNMSACGTFFTLTASQVRLGNRHESFTESAEKIVSTLKNKLFLTSVKTDCTECCTFQFSPCVPFLRFMAAIPAAPAAAPTPPAM